MKKVSKVMARLLVIILTIQLAVPLNVTAAAKPKLSNTKLTLEVGKTKKLKVKNTKKKVKWSSNETSVAKVSSKGNVKAIKAGSAVISAKIDSTVLKCKVTVKNAKVALNKKDAKLCIGEQITLELKNAKTVSWSSENEEIAVVSDEGIVTGVNKGETLIKAYDEKTKKTYTCEVVVERKSLCLYAPKEMTIVPGNCSIFSSNDIRRALNIKGDPIKKDVQWSTSDDTIMYYDEGEKCFFLVGYGECILEAKSDGKTYVYDVTVVSENSYAMTDDDFDFINIGLEGFSNYFKDMDKIPNGIISASYNTMDYGQNWETPRGIKLGSTAQEVYEAYGVCSTGSVNSNYDDEEHTAKMSLRYHYRKKAEDTCYIVCYYLDQNNEVMAIIYEPHKWHWQ